MLLAIASLRQPSRYLKLVGGPNLLEHVMYVLCLTYIYIYINDHHHDHQDHHDDDHHNDDQQQQHQTYSKLIIRKHA